MESQKKKLLIIEDDASLQLVYKHKFEMEGFEVFQAYTGQQGLTFARDKVPDMILLDIMLPEGMNGFDVMEQLKRDEKLGKIPIIMFTNLDSEKETALSLGAVDYVVKSNTSIDELTEKVKSHIK
ncbi:hypothetical protein A2Z33_02695 [Candidatus Gottesmanbacteria bacterium RBG_16_52_11]|uniref:Response regulatory domain-containing protein n=1 Tax=Candidatus Gottesmanbacteria bacterium RBG_16_52_11 TaxID=1798374 RepID=A0A1F5YNF1_9BACT|nr:MAG: hypothetical protein A2Z33_02695 [Candidatus Gottesmanbacteria bacterium RBG_16_52_11]